jgi:type II secretory pathway predicted ATPase ExeA
MAAPRTQFYHPAKLIDAALGGIDRAIRRAEGIALVVGSPGTGKSLLLAKLAESESDDFSVALLCGARICTRRALWQSILAELGQAYRGIDEAELRIAVVEMVRGLANRGSGLVILVDEAHTLPLRLIEELRLLANMPTPLPAVHIVLAGTAALEERLGNAKMESFAQRIAVRAYLEPLDHAETVAYLRTQTRAAGLEWDALFEPGSDDAIYQAADGVPRLVNQVCDQALVLAAGTGRRVRPADIAAAWREIQRLPSPRSLDGAEVATGDGGAMRSAARPPDAGPAGAGHAAREGDGMIEFGSLDDGFDDLDAVDEPTQLAETEFAPERLDPLAAFDDVLTTGGAAAVAEAFPGDVLDALDGGQGDGRGDPWQGPDVEFVFDASTDPFQEFFEQEERVVERYLLRSPADFSGRQHVVSSEGAALVRQLAEFDEPVAEPTPRSPADGFERREDAGGRAETEARGGAGQRGDAVDGDSDGDMVVIEEDLLAAPGPQPTVAAVRLGDYRRLFARLRRGG